MVKEPVSPSLETGSDDLRWLIDRFASGGDRRAFIHAGRCVTYSEIMRKINQFALAVESQGIGRGDRVAMIADYSPQVFCMLMALALRGALVIPLGREAIVEQDNALRISGCEWIVEFDDEGLKSSIRRHVVEVDNALVSEFRTRRRPGLILFTSGSTGKPKGILHDLVLVAEKFRKPRSPIVAIAFLMIDHFGGINTILAITSSLGTVITVHDRSIDSICRAIEESRVELLPATPSFLTMLITSGRHREFDLSSLRRITYGTEVMPQSTLHRLCEAFPGVELQQTYGLSEVGVLRSQSRADGSLWVRLGGEGFETEIRDGILWVRSKYAMVGYLNAGNPFDDEGWFNTQDRVEVDGEFFRILGRTTDIINVGGQKVYPAEVEDAILGMDNVADVAVTSESHPLLGQIVVAKIVTVEPESPANLKKRVRSWCLGRLANYKVPSKVLVAEGSLYTVRQKKIRSNPGRRADVPSP
ncbi:MAG TPA: long-chain fatty acid--CoA ligase [Bauldia sp.]|nr:long-chain fatty acid--CoA ligase [Bauldia sp.]